MLEIIISILGGAVLIKYIKPKVEEKLKPKMDVFENVTVKDVVDMSLKKSPISLKDEVAFKENINYLKRIMEKADTELNNVVTQGEQDTLLLLKVISERLITFLSANYKVLAGSNYTDNLLYSYSNINKATKVLVPLDFNESRLVKFKITIESVKLLSDTLNFLELSLKQITSMNALHEYQDLKIMESLVKSQKLNQEDMELTDKFNEEYLEMRVNHMKEVLQGLEKN